MDRVGQMIKDELNDYGIFLTDKFILNYYNIIVIFDVCGTTKNSVILYELETKKTEINGKNAVILDKKLSPSKKTYFVPVDENSFTKSRFEIQPTYLNGELRIPLAVPYGSKLYNKAVEEGHQYPAYGIVYAEPLKEFRNIYWIVEKEEKKHDDTRPHFDA